jgi:ELWxxDGT repeat protein
MSRSLRCVLLLAALASPGIRAAAQEPSLLADLNPNSGEPAAVGSRPRQFTAVSGRVVFVTGGEDPADPEYRLWATDGTAAGTEVIAILCNLASCREPQRLGRLANLVFFQVVATESNPALSLWRTDGTRAGTFPVSAPLYPDFTFGGTGVVAGGRLLFRACEDGTSSSCGLWSTDGSVGGTRKVVDLQIGMIASTGRRIVFTAVDATGFGLWVSDGTPGGTELVTRQGVRLLTASGSKVFFMAGNDDYPSDLWVSDGTKAGTRLVEKFSEPFHRLPPNTRFLKPVPGGIVFVGNARLRPGVDLWRSDGTRKGTRPLTAFQDGSGLGPLREDQIAVVGDRVFFMVFGTAGPRLWTSRGTPQTAGPVTGCAGPGGCPALSADTPLAVAGNRVVFVARDTAHGTEPWTSDGTGAGTRLLRDLCPGTCGSDSNGFVAHAGIVDFRSTWGNVTRLVRTDGRTAVILARIAPPPPPDPDNPYNYVPPPLDLADLSGKTFFAGLDPVFGLQPWVTDGTRPGTRRIDALEDAGASSNPRNFLVLGNQLLFTANDGTEHVLWRISPSGSLSRLAGTGVPASEPGPAELTESGLFAYYVVDHGRDEELWRTDGTPAGTVRLASFQDKTLSNLRGFLDGGNRILFLVSSTTGEQPVHSFWESNGTPAGTVKRFDDLPADTVTVTDVAAVGAELYFLLRREGASQIFRSDGTAAGTRMIFQLACDCGGLVRIQYLRFRGSVYFTAWGNSGITLYRTDGTAEGTVQVVPAPGDNSFQGSGPQALFEFQSELYFFARNPDADTSPTAPAWALWKSNGNDAVLVKKVGFRYSDPVDPQFAAELGGPLYFRAWDAEHGFELWKTDGTAAGTVLVADIEPGPFSSDPRGLVATGGRVWFSALDRVHGRELWTSDGTAGGTRRVADIAPGGLSSAPEELTPFAGRLYFSADDGVRGREPWSLPLP